MGSLLARLKELEANLASRLPGGVLVFETHAHHADAVCALVTESGFIDVQLQHDLAGRPRIVTAHWPVDL